MITRTSPIPGLGQFTQAAGAAFALPVGQVSEPLRSREAVVVMRVDRRVAADKGAWQAQKQQQREQVTAQLRQQRVRTFLEGLRESAKIVDRREELRDAARRQSAS
jgi:parvulin-like peptidyl-prolyl isomerase